MQGLIGPLKELAEFEELCKNKKKDQLLFYMVLKLLNHRQINRCE